jgi:DNA-3-methyladenine glycosylase II
LHSFSGTLDARQPFAFQRSVDFLRGFSSMSGEQSAEKGEVTKAMMVDGKTVVFTVREEGAALRYELFSEERLGEDVIERVAKQISFFFSLDDDVKPFYSIAREQDERFYPLVERLWGLHEVKFLTLLEASSWALINQRMHRSTALRIKRSLVERFGEKMELNGRAYWAFPDRPRLEGSTARGLLEVTGNQRVAVRLSSLYSSLDELDESFLRNAPYEKANERLQKIKGIGDWSAQFILFRGLGRMGKVQEINVRHLKDALVRTYGREKELEQVNSTYGEWVGYWLLYLWASTMSSANDES